MIVYGWNSKVLKESPFPGQKCTSCEAEDSYVVVTGSYAHIFWIPLFPYRKKLTIVCGNCGLDTKPKQVSPEVKQFAKKLKSTVRFPLYMFSGSGLVAILIGIFAIIGFIDNKKIEGYLNEPQVNDIYYLYNDEEISEYKYYLWKVTEVAGDSIYVSPNSFQYNYIPSRLEDEDGFFDVQFIMNKSDVMNLFEEDVIRQVDRGFKDGSGFERQIEYTGEPESPEEGN